MNKDTLKGNWNQLKGKIKQKWGKLTDDDITAINGSYDQLVGKIQEKHGIARDKAEQELKDFDKDHNL